MGSRQLLVVENSRPSQTILKFLPLKYLKMTSLLTVFNKFKPFVEEFPLRIVHWKGKKNKHKVKLQKSTLTPRSRV